MGPDQQLNLQAFMPRQSVTVGKNTFDISMQLFNCQLIYLISHEIWTIKFREKPGRWPSANWDKKMWTFAAGTFGNFPNFWKREKVAQKSSPEFWSSDLVLLIFCRSLLRNVQVWPSPALPKPQGNFPRLQIWKGSNLSKVTWFGNANASPKSSMAEVFILRKLRFWAKIRP